MLFAACAFPATGSTHKQAGQQSAGPPGAHPLLPNPRLSAYPYQCVQAAVPPVKVPAIAPLASPPGTAVSNHRATPLPPLVLPKPELSLVFGGLAPAPAPLLGPAPAPGPSLNLLGAILGPGVAVETAPTPQQKIIPSVLPFIAGPPEPATVAAPVLAPSGATAVPPVAVQLVHPMEPPAALPAPLAPTLAPPEAAPPGDRREPQSRNPRSCCLLSACATTCCLCPQDCCHAGACPCKMTASHPAPKCLCTANHPTCGACRSAIQLQGLQVQGIHTRQHSPCSAGPSILPVVPLLAGATAPAAGPALLPVTPVVAEAPLLPAAAVLPVAEAPLQPQLLAPLPAAVLPAAASPPSVAVPPTAAEGSVSALSIATSPAPGCTDVPPGSNFTCQQQVGMPATALTVPGQAMDVPIASSLTMPGRQTACCRPLTWLGTSAVHLLCSTAAFQRCLHWPCMQQL